ncbi:MAG: glycine/sarcosine/betaine reductase complex component C subunit beta [Desulfocapsaceae bacterium]|nr:glycine/sarcosine/betaine reductase complex component C subunit beta [Desulfocapsaceae bacterium]
MEKIAVIQSCSYCLMHLPDLVRYGSKPRRETVLAQDLPEKLQAALRSYEEAAAYPPNQTFIGKISPEELADIPRPWFRQESSASPVDSCREPFGEILDQEGFLALLKAADILTPQLFQVIPSRLPLLQRRLSQHPLFCDTILQATEGEHLLSESPDPVDSSGLALKNGKILYGYFHGDKREEGRDDENLSAHNLLENLCSKASGALALQWLLHRAAIGPEKIDFIISCGEEACGDRYQRGGGGMAKAMGEMCGCANASGMDIKNFCAAPASALITAAALVSSGVYRRVAVVGGGSLAKLGMKFQAFLGQNMPILDDCLASMAFLVTADDRKSPWIRIGQGATGAIPINASTTDEQVFLHYLLHPLHNLGLNCRQIDKYAPELHNPEIMEFSGAGDVAGKNYRKIAATAVMAGHLDKAEMKEWIKKIGMPGFAPTQGHIPSAVPYIGHAMVAMEAGKMERAMFLARASLFLNRCTRLLDGVSFILERNPHLTTKKE